MKYTETFRYLLFKEDLKLAIVDRIGTHSRGGGGGGIFFWGGGGG